MTCLHEHASHPKPLVQYWFNVGPERKGDSACLVDLRMIIYKNMVRRDVYASSPLQALNLSGSMLSLTPGSKTHLRLLPSAHVAAKDALGLECTGLMAELQAGWGSCQEGIPVMLTLCKAPVGPCFQLQQKVDSGQVLGYSQVGFPMMQAPGRASIQHGRSPKLYLHPQVDCCSLRVGLGKVLDSCPA